jgi:hypothetical protein
MPFELWLRFRRKTTRGDSLCDTGKWINFFLNPKKFSLHITPTFNFNWFLLFDVSIT